MNDVVSFVTPGLIDPRCITTIGVSVKETENPIGFFGTGLKYAIAIILRSGGEITVWRGLEPYRFGTAATVIRGKEVRIVTMNGQELGFTTDLGKHWAMWQAFREIYCNTVDERGACEAGDVQPKPDTTTVRVASREFAECQANIGAYILQTQPVYPGPIIAFHPGAGHAVFYRTIRVSDAITPKPFLFAPNLLERIELTEDRTIKDSWHAFHAIARAVCTSKDEAFIERWIGAAPDYAEHEFDLDWSSIEPSAAFLKVAAALARDTSRPLNVTALKVLAKRQAPPPPIEAELFPSETEALHKAIDFCRALKYPVDEFPIRVVESLGLEVLGKADVKAREILLARRAIQLGDMTCASTLIEEWAHIKHGFDDCSRRMQNWLFEQLTRIGDAYLFEIGNAK